VLLLAPGLQYACEQVGAYLDASELTQWRGRSEAAEAAVGKKGAAGLTTVSPE
jgi:hypothetical protein